MATVVLHPYSSDWPIAFAQAQDELVAAFAPVHVSIEHVGSTSVPGLAAKPVIDMLLGVTSLREVEARIAKLDELGYHYVSKYEQEMPHRRYFVKSSLSGLRGHLHAVEKGGQFWSQHLVFRDRLRADPSLRAAYQALKMGLAAEFPHDKAAYQAAKEPFIRSVLASMFCV